MPLLIDKFRGEYAFLSNFFPTLTEFEGLTYLSSEAAYQAAKTTDEKIRMNFIQMTGAESKRYGKTITLRDDWEDIKLDVMREVIFNKFSSNKELRDKLLKTGEAKLVEGNTWGDSWWGIYSGTGENWLGRILMEVRDILK